MADNLLRYKATVTVVDPCVGVTVTPDASIGESMEIALEKGSSTFNYLLKRVDDTLDNGGVYSSAATNIILFSSSDSARCPMSGYELYLASDLTT
jgi:hypothetical protein